MQITICTLKKRYLFNSFSFIVVYLKLMVLFGQIAQFLKNKKKNKNYLNGKGKNYKRRYKNKA